MRGQSGVNAPLFGQPVEALHDIKQTTHTASNRRVNQFETNETSLISRQQGDFVFCAASSSELPRYGVKHGLTNWTSAYATGLLCARRALKKLGLDEKYEGITEPDGEMTITEACKFGRDSIRCEEGTRC
jgi:ribosomal protein L18